MGRRKHPEPLTPAEQRVLEEIKVGGSNAEIAVRLGLSINTVKYHVANMLAKLEMDDRQALRQWDISTSRAVTWRRAAVVAAGLAGVIAIIVAVALLFPDRDSEAQSDQVWWFETVVNSDRTPDGLLIREILSGKEHRITPLPDEQVFIPQWSPNGARLSAFVAPHDVTKTRLRLWKNTGDEVATLALVGLPNWYYWAPDSRHVLAVSDELAIFDSDGKKVAATRLDAPQFEGGSVTSGALWSPDSRRFAYLYNGLLVVVGIDGTSQRLQLTDVNVGIDSTPATFGLQGWTDNERLDVRHLTSRLETESFEVRIVGSMLELDGPTSSPPWSPTPLPDYPDEERLKATMPNMVFIGGFQSSDGRARAYQFNKPYPIPGEVRPATIVVVIGGKDFTFQTRSEPILGSKPITNAGLAVTGNWDRP